MLELRNIRKSYHSRLILQISSLQLHHGIYWVKGVNGSGKTTLLKMIAGLLPFEGDIIIETFSQKKNPVLYRQNISWAEAEPLYPSFITGKDLILLYRDLRSTQQQEINKLIELLNMGEYITEAIGTYSAGMKKKLSLLLAFIGKLPFCILDEPLITLDAGSLASVCSYIHERYKNDGTTFLMSSHQEVITQITLSGKELIIDNQSIILNGSGK